MAARIVRLGTPRGKAEGVRIGTVRRPPRRRGPPARKGGGVAFGRGRPPPARRPKGRFPPPPLLRRLVPDARAEPADDEARPGGEDTGRVDAIREEVQSRNGEARCEPR